MYEKKMPLILRQCKKLVSHFIYLTENLKGSTILFKKYIKSNYSSLRRMLGLKKSISVFFVLVLSLVFGSAALAEKDTLVVADQYDATSFDPIRANDLPSTRACFSVYDPLIFLNEDGSAYPGLAEKWEFLSDTEFKFYLRKGVKFHNGEIMTAEDVKFSFERAMSDLGVAVRTYSQAIKEVEAIDENTVIIRLKEPDYSFFPSLSHTWSGILSKKAVEAAGENYGTVSSGPVGTGPFKFVSWEKGNKYTLERFDDFWGEKPKYKKLVVRSIPEPVNRIVGLETGELDLVYPVAAHDLKRLQENSNLAIDRKLLNAINYMSFNMKKAPFQDVRVRKAIDAALDTVGIKKAVWQEVGQIPLSVVPATVKYSIENELKPHVQDIELSKKLFAEAGVDPSTLKFELWTNERKDRTDMAQIIQAQLAELGITVEIKVLEWGAYLSGLKEGKHDLFMLGWSAPVPDPHFSIFILLESKSALNYTYFNDPKLDGLLASGRAVPDGAEREKIYKEIQYYINEQAPMVYTFTPEIIFGMQKNVKGFAPSSGETHSFRHVYFE